VADFMDDAKEKAELSKQSLALTRREWLAGVGPAVVLSRLPLPPIKEQASGSSLPPGLHAPSFDHLAHVLGSDGAFLPVPAGTETEYLRPRTGPFVPQAFVQDDFAIVRRLVEIILGEDLRNSTEKVERGAPASIYDDVAEWIDLVVANAPKVRALAKNLPAEHRALTVAYFGSEEPVRELETFEPERLCHEGLAWLDEESHRRSAKRFLDATPAGQVQIVHAINDARPEKSATHAGTRLFDFLKAESIRGFYTSPAGLKELDYKGNAYYGEPPGCGLTRTG
jgi:hypothetical protein